MSVLLNLHEIKIAKVVTVPEIPFNLVYKDEISETKVSWFGLCREENIIEREGWYDEKGNYEFSDSTFKRLLLRGDIKVTPDGYKYVPYLSIIDTKDNQYVERFDSDAELNERVEEIRTKGKCDLFIIKN